jgi:hypothetical protein
MCFLVLQNILDQVLQIGQRLPRIVLLVIVSLPLDEVVPLPLDNPEVEYLLALVGILLY